MNTSDPEDHQNERPEIKQTHYVDPYYHLDDTRYKLSGIGSPQPTKRSPDATTPAPSTHQEGAHTPTYIGDTVAIERSPASIEKDQAIATARHVLVSAGHNISRHEAMQLARQLLRELGLPYRA